MKLDRLMGILVILLQNKRVTAPWLSEKFEVTRRTINRDIDILCQAGIPIITYQGTGGGISIADGFKLDKSILTVDELSSMITALKGIESIYEKPQIQRTLDKLSANSDTVISLKESVIIDLASHNKGSLSAKIMLIKDAVQKQKLIEFDYYYEKGQTHRLIEPYFVIFQWTAWYVFGFCRERKDWRMFKLARLWGLKECDESYIQREIPPESRNFNNYFTDENKLVALFDASVKYQLIEEYGLDCFTETSEGRLRLEILYTNRNYIISWLLSFGDKAKVIEPADLGEEIMAIAEEMIHNYRK